MAEKKYNTEPYMDSIRAYRTALMDALAVADDPFKAPELTVGTAQPVAAAAWEMQVQYHAMTNYRNNVTEEE